MTEVIETRLYRSRDCHPEPKAKDLREAADPEGVSEQPLRGDPSLALRMTVKEHLSSTTSQSSDADGALPLGRVLVLGLGKSGKSAARYCAEMIGGRVESLFIAAGAETDDSKAFLESIARTGLDWAFGDSALEQVEGDFDLCIASPGIPFWHDLYVAGRERSRALVSEVEFAWRESAPDSVWVAITGTNGKTTTTSCCAHVLQACGFAASAVGNIGDVCLDAVAAGDTQVYVAEVSSYQLYSTHDFTPDVAVLLNITPDHIHWHQTLDAYAEAKFNVLRGVCPPASGSAHGAHPIAILDATNDVVRAKVRELRQTSADYIPMGTASGMREDMRARCGARNAAFIGEDGLLVVAYDGVEHVLGNESDLKIHGEHNASNALAAAAIAVALGADDGEIARALMSFEPLAHRIEPCGSIAGVACYNDSKATNVDATLKALEAFPGKRVAVLLGGDDKHTDLADLVAAACEHAAFAICYGQAGPRFAEAFDGASGIEVLRASHMRDALEVAIALGDSIDVILLSPACASFDEFSSFEERGDVFKELVATRSGEGA